MGRLRPEPRNGCESDIYSDLGHCGGCFNACSLVRVDTPVCSLGVCTPVCDAGYGDCNGASPGTAGDGCETSLLDSPNDCGVCGNACSSGGAESRRCIDGACRPACQAGYSDCVLAGVGESDDGCETTTASDSDNCGGCGNRCDTTNVEVNDCVSGACTPLCSAGWEDCSAAAPGQPGDGCETDVDGDVENCGGCGNGCDTTNVEVNDCVSGACTPLCSAGWEDCLAATPGQPGDGCETDVDSDVENCGACGNVCSTTQVANNVCNAGQCTPTCNGTFADCNQAAPRAPGDGCETDLDTSVLNCGVCGNACDATNVLVNQCYGGACNPVCDSGYSDCTQAAPGAPGDGCETATGTDPNNCGQCGNLCSYNNVASPGCADGTCAPSCVAGHADCVPALPGQSGFGCETNTLVSPKDCGACGNECSLDNVATTQCTDGICTPVCEPLYADCNVAEPGAPGDGCERYVNTETDCGACDHSCLGGTCQSGVCQPVVLVSGLVSAKAVAATADYVYYTHGASGSAEVVRRIPYPGPVAETTLVSNQGFIFDLLVDGPTLYAGETDAVFQGSLLGSSMSRVWSNTSITPGGEIATDATQVFMADVYTRDAWRVSKTGGTPLALTATLDVTPGDIEVNDTHVFVASDALYRVPKNGGTVITISGLAPYYPSQIEIIPNGPIVIGTNVSILFLQPTEAAMEAVVMGESPGEPKGMVVSAEGIIIATRNALYRAFNDGRPPEFITGGFHSVRDLAVAGGAAYVVDEGTAPTTGTGSITKIAF